MIQVQQQSQIEASLLGGIQQEMPVYDVDDIKLGIVCRVSSGCNFEEIQILQDMTDMPAILRLHLQLEGYIEVDTGLFGGNYYVLPHQIADVTPEGVFLLCRSDELIRY